MDNTVGLEQLEKRVEWLDNERRNDKTIIAALQSKLDSVDTENAALRLRLADMDSEITRLNTLMARLEQYETSIAEVRTDTGRELAGFDETLKENALQTEKHYQNIESINEKMLEMRKKIQNLDSLESELSRRKDEEIRLNKLIDELTKRVSESENFHEDYKRSLRLIEEGRRQDAKRLTDLQGELAAMRKRQDETRGKQDLVGDSMRKLESRIKDLHKAESERRESQTAFTEKMKLANVERDRIFKEWSGRFDEVERITTGLEKELKDIENTHRSIKQSQAALDEVTQRFDRRINEITEIQRLNEDRFRQEWTTFKSDDQKRWTNYTLAQEEQHREMSRAIENLSNRITTLEDKLENIQDQFQQIGKDDVKRMTYLVNSLRESIEIYNSLFNE
jgi:chromosome segregation ATPase